MNAITHTVPGTNAVISIVQRDVDDFLVRISGDVLGAPCLSSFAEPSLEAARHEANAEWKMLVNTRNLLLAKRAEEEASQRVTSPGVFRKDGEVFIVKPNREKTRLYAKRLVEIGGERLTETGEHVHIEFEYAKGVIYDLRESHRMPVDEGKALTIRYGRCICCGRRLKAAQSVERGIGPVCVKYFA